MKNIIKTVVILVLSVGVYAYTHTATTTQQETSKISTNNLLAISWQNAFCETHRNKKECRNVKPTAYSATHFTLHGLWPQPKNNTFCKKTERVFLDKPLYSELLHVMPAARSGLHQHEWKKHGTCYNSSPERYFQDSIALVQQINRSEVRHFFARNIGENVTIKQVRFTFDKAFGQGSGRKIKMQCQKGMITELQINLKGDIASMSTLSKLMHNAPNAQDGCQRGRIDRVGY
jgi:ribonuclease T2